ncbi:MAG: hypothetical protein HRK26_00870 [Rickettsiaceae bacterium H1]|nr:hypothetical protein [Rickettsiaceae bacterium H1]
MNVSNIASYGAIVFGISYAFSKDLKLSGIIGGSAAAAVLLLQVGIFAIEKVQGESTEQALADSSLQFNYWYYRCSCHRERYEEPVNLKSIKAE